MSFKKFTDKFKSNNPEKEVEEISQEQNASLDQDDSQKLAKEIEELRVKNDLLLRVTAEKENQIKHLNEIAKKDIQIAKDDYAKKFIGEVAPEFDNLFRIVPELSKKFNDSGFDALDKTIEKIKESFKKVGVEFLMPAVGEDFNPEIHNVVTYVAQPEMQDGQIVHVISSCWKVGDRTVRCADVIVAKNS
jgi:molecular chaperone GrpE